VSIALGDRSYDIQIGAGLLGQSAAWEGLPAAAAALIVTNTTVEPLYAAQLREALAPRYRSVIQVVLPDGEAHKDWQTLNLIFDALLTHGCDRKTVLFALGGGVVGDMTGFAAASYMRGVPFVQVPTTLLAPGGLLGRRQDGDQPSARQEHDRGLLPAGTRGLRSRDIEHIAARELSAGLAEVIKYGPIADMSFLDWIEANAEALLQRDPNALAYAVRRSCEIKAEVVGQDERESGLRAILNFGHTFGHAIEAGLGYGEWLHGEAVGCGMVMACSCHAGLGLVDPAFVERVTRLISRAGLPTVGPSLGPERYL
jgi:3-dehydroquinate synthase